MQNKNNMNYEYEHIEPEKFAFAQLDADIHDKKLETKSRGYFADALIRFKKNKSSVIAAYIILIIIIFTIISPLLSPYDIEDVDKVYTNAPPFVRVISDLNLGIMNGAVTHESQNEVQYAYWQGIAKETGYNPLIKIVDTYTTVSMFRGQEKTSYTYKLQTNKYYETGVVYRTVSYEEFQKIQDFQNETGIQVIYPYVESKDIYNITDNPNIWYEVSDAKGTPKRDASGNFVFNPVYSKNTNMAGAEYNSLRIEGDDGSYIYSYQKSGAVHIRVCYYNYYTYLNGHEPIYIFGTNSLGQDLFSAIGVGSRFSLVFALVVSAINLSIGAVYGSIQGYYGGVIDLVLDRISDILSCVPFTVVTILFQFHLAQKVGPVVSFLFAFVLTGWIGMAALTRKQFYRFKSQEFVFAARTLGASDARLMFKHIFPNSLGTIITSCALVIPSVISSETSLTYLGIINLSELAGTSIGTLMSQGQTSMTTSPHAMFFPALYFSLLLISFNLFGNGLRDAFNPSTRGVED
ncbi:MAG: ABC transporter permease [Clostridia bacterium]|nr:ABC transporter permease [Clostridia bacterium]